MTCELALISGDSHACVSRLCACTYSQDKALQQPPSAIMVMVGPRSCGKTRLLMHKAAQHYRMPPEDVDLMEQPPGWLDGRMAQLDSPGVMADELYCSIKDGRLPAALQCLRSTPFTVDFKVSLPLPLQWLSLKLGLKPEKPEKPDRCREDGRGALQEVQWEWKGVGRPLAPAGSG